MILKYFKRKIGAYLLGREDLMAAAAKKLAADNSVLVNEAMLKHFIKGVGDNVVVKERFVRLLLADKSLMTNFIEQPQILKKASKKIIANRKLSHQMIEELADFNKLIRHIGANPELAHRILTHPTIRAQLPAQAGFFSGVASRPDLLRLIFDQMDASTKGQALQALFQQEADLVLNRLDYGVKLAASTNLLQGGAGELGATDVEKTFIDSLSAIGAEHLGAIISQFIQRRPSVLIDTLKSPEMANFAVEAVCKSPQSVKLLMSIILAQAGTGSTEGCLQVLNQIFTHPAFVSQLSDNDEFKLEVSEILQMGLKCIEGEVDQTPLTPLQKMDLAIDDESHSAFKGLKDVGDQAEQIYALERYLHPTAVAAGRATIGNSPELTVESYLLGALNSSNNEEFVHLPMKTGPFKLHDLKGFLTVAEEIFAREEYFCKMPDAPYILDCGSNIGVSVLYLKTKFPLAKVRAFEPVPFICEILSENVANCGLTNVEVNQTAVCDTTGTMVLNVDKENSLAASLTNRRVDKKADTEACEVATVSLKSLLDQSVDLLKLDIEGAEFDALIACGDKISSVNYLFCECHCDDYKTQKKLAKLLAYLSENNFDFQIARSAWAERRYSDKPLRFVSRSASYSLYAINRNWPTE